MLVEKVVGDPLAGQIDLDTLDREVPARQGTVDVRVEEVGFEHLNLERQGIAVAGFAKPTADQDFPALDNGPHREVLQAVDVVATVCVDVGRLEMRLDEVADPLRPAIRPRADSWRDAGADDVVLDGGDAARGDGIVPHEVAGDAAQPDQAEPGLRVGVGQRRSPAGGSAGKCSPFVQRSNLLDARDPVAGRLALQGEPRRDGLDGPLEPLRHQKPPL